jgi:hypothetical protein
MVAETLLYRQVHPSFVDNNKISAQVFGQITSSVFKPTPKDEGLLSVYNSQHFQPEMAHLHYTTISKLDSRGVAAVSYEECIEQTLEVVADNNPFIGHASIDFRDKSTNQKEKIAKRLKRYAIERSPDESGLLFDIERD